MTFTGDGGNMYFRNTGIDTSGYKVVSQDTTHEFSSPWQHQILSFTLNPSLHLSEMELGIFSFKSGLLRKCWPPIV